MFIRFVRSGGFTGMRMTYETDTNTLPPDESRKVRAFIDTSDFFNLPKIIPPAGKGADQYTYVLTIEGEQKTHTIQVSETAVPPELRPLIRYFMDQAKKK